MLDRTLKVLARVQAVRDTAAKRTLEDAARKVKESQASMDALGREAELVRLEVNDAGESRLAAHAERYLGIVEQRRSAAGEQLAEREQARDRARREYVRTMARSGVVSRKAQEKSGEE